jgi:hypothetical protein
MIDFEKLRAPFAPDRVSWRVGSTTQDKSKGLAFAYIDARDVMDRLDDVCGPGGWQNNYPHANGKTVCAIGIKVGDEWIWKANGAGDSDVEAEKGALSDALKRAAVQWGIGRYLYDVTPPWVEIEPMGKSFKIKEHEYRRLRRLLTGEAPPPEPKAPVPEDPAAKPVFIPRPKDGWSPAAANVFGKQFLDVARKLPKPARQEHYRMNEPLIGEIRALSSAAADYIDNKFAELT